MRLPDAMWCYRRDSELEPGALPATRSGRFTFGSLNNVAKASAEAVSLWAKVLRSVPGARMVVLCGTGRSAEERLLDLFALHGVAAERIHLAGRRDRAGYFGLYQEIDLILDPFPYTGCTTTCDALWMGVPVVTLAGPTSMSRQSMAPLTLAGLADLVTTTPEAYVQTAVRLAEDTARLGTLRRELRESLLHSPMMDADTYLRNLEAAYRMMWDAREPRRHHSQPEEAGAFLDR